MPGWLRISHVWNNPATGTPPYVTGMWALAPDEADEESVLGLLNNIKAVYNDAFDALQNDALGPGELVGNYADETTAYDVTVTGLDPAGGGGYGNPGWSLRAVLQGARPPRGRANQMYWPYVDTTYYTAAGTVAGGASTLLNNWADDILDVLQTRGLTVTDEQRERIMSTSDLELLKTWLRRAVTVAASSRP